MIGFLDWATWILLIFSLGLLGYAMGSLITHHGVKTVTREDWFVLDEWKRSWFTWQIEFFGGGIDNTYEFKRIGPFVVGGAYWLRNEEGKRYLSSPREVASSTWGIGYPDESPPHLS